MQLQTTNMFVGFSALQMCSGRFGWKERVEVCMELFAAVNTTLNPEAESVIQGNQCSFGSVIFELKEPRPGSFIPPPPQRPPGLRPNQPSPPRNGRNMSNDSNRMMQPGSRGVCIPFRVTVPGLSPPNQPPPPRNGRNMSNDNGMMMRPGSPRPPPPRNGMNMSSNSDQRMRPKSREHCMTLNGMKYIYFFKMLSSNNDFWYFQVQ